MTSYWKKLTKRLFEKKPKKKGASDVIREFDESKEMISKELEEKKGEFKEKVSLLYKTSETKTQILMKKPDDSIVEEHALHTLNLIQDLAKAGFPGASILSESLARYGAAALPGPSTFLLLKASVFVIDEPEPVIEVPVEAAVDEKKRELPVEEVEKPPVIAEKEVLIEPKPAEDTGEPTESPAAPEEKTVTTEESVKSKALTEAAVAAPSTSEPATVVTPARPENVPDAAPVSKADESSEAPKVEKPVSNLTSETKFAAALPPERATPEKAPEAAPISKADKLKDVLEPEKKPVSYPTPQTGSAAAVPTAIATADKVPDAAPAYESKDAPKIEEAAVSDPKPQTAPAPSA
ncbi:hypothetical protein O6H91_16G007400 [Diphasiastrum complanatum]|uniref:Uncharacterized protein n=2 Tax=Diphasiastrum complanatum TaxID=34168 RepID=A0ACC2B9Q4_DIPCM|nr:hypothetical protein O6H91_16G007400 [Diphasiastrum complanatum]KAJ7526461.1 hypothetical protein O6H91_16G007400 [Diphasiastrum complanatum]